MTRNFWNVKERFKLSRGASFQVVKFQKQITSTLTPPPQFRPYEFVVQRVSRAMAKVMKSPVQASLHVFSKTFCPKLDFFYCIYRFLSAGDCHHGNRLVSVVFKLCKRIISPIDMTSFYKTTHDKIHEYYSVF